MMQWLDGSIPQWFNGSMTQFFDQRFGLLQAFDIKSFVHRVIGPLMKTILQ